MKQINEFIKKMNNLKRVTMVLAVAIVFVTSYSLVLPAIAIDQDEAASQPGMNVSSDKAETESSKAETESSKTDAAGSKADAASDKPAAESDKADADSDKQAAGSEPDADAAAKASSANPLMTADGRDYSVSLSYNKKAGIPADAALEVEELTSKSGGYAEYVSAAEKALGLEKGAAGYIRLFDISIVDKDDSSRKYQPAKGQTVDVKIELADVEGADVGVVHFAEGTRKGEAVDNTAKDAEKGQVVSFEAEGFSVYAIVSDFISPEYETRVSSIEENTGYYLSNTDGSLNYMTNGVNTTDEPNGMIRTPSRMFADIFYFEKAENENEYFIYTEIDGERNYLYFEYMNHDSGHLKLTTDKPESPMKVRLYSASNGQFYISGTAEDGEGNSGTWYINQYGGNSGNRFAGWHQENNGSRTRITQPVELENDAFGLDGKTYGLINFKSDISGYALMADSATNQRLQRKWMLIREDSLEHNGRVFIAENTDIPMWKFHAVGGDIYYLTTEIDGVTKFLSVQSGGLTMADEYDDTCNIQLTAGTGNYNGKLKLTGMDGSTIRMFDNGFGPTAAAQNENDFFNLAVKSDLTDADFVSYSAEKVSVSDKVNVADGKQVIVYTRAWNDTTKEYEFYAIDHDGSLYRIYENGDELNWVGTQINTLLWDFTEYTNSDGTPNYYYELQSNYSGKYLAPQISGNKILFDEPVGINLNGRRYEKYTSTILAWDDPDYAYSSFKVENGHLVPCPMSQAEDLYFAVMLKTDPDDQEDKLTTVETVDNNDYGITMKMIDYNGVKTNNGTFDETQTVVMGSTGNDKGLVKPYLEDNYPTAVKTGTSLSTLFEGAEPVNHMFLAGTYNESGYFEYNCTENFAHLVQPDDEYWISQGYNVGDFVIYDQVATIDNSGNGSLKHGQFMPYNDLEEGRLSQDWTNQTDETDAPLKYDDPRKDMPLYAIPHNANNDPNTANYHFGMEMTASFTQTASGLDAWGHDIIFEFAGDDDMYLFVDDILVLDLGGVHAAQTGKINFRTGQMTSSKGNGNLRDLFRTSYKAQYPQATDAEVNEWLKTIFKVDDRGNITTVFQDYSTHTMRMIYMERGAGASNLHMRFNLAAVKPGTVLLSKKLSGVDDQSAVLAEFPYQIWYKQQSDGESEWHLLGENEGDQNRVKYYGSNMNVKYRQSYTAVGADEPYSHVFFLQPGEEAEITMPEDVTEYKVIECGVNPHIYDDIIVNGESVDGENYGTVTQNGEKSDYGTDSATLDERQTVEYTNHIGEGALRTLQLKKELFDVSGNPIYHDEDATPFDFRLYLGGENDTDPGAANMRPYHVRDENGNYCRWSSDAGTFVSLGKTDFDALTAAEKESATFHTSINGSITYIPVDYTVEVRNILAGSHFRVVERENEVPKGYSWKGYVLDGEQIEGSQADGVGGIITEEDSPLAVVQNFKGWGLTVEKIWSDADYMASHDTIYFAIFKKGQGDELTLMDGTVRAMRTDENSIYWYFEHLEEGVSFDRYCVREVTLSEDEPSVSEDGVVTDYGTVTPIEEGGKLNINGTPLLDMTEAPFTYDVSYEQGTIDQNKDNIRTDKITNSRPGIRIVKTDWDGNPLKNGVFTLKDGDGSDVGQKSYRSGEDGLVTLAYLPDGIFTLDETRAPHGYSGLHGPLTITREGDEITLSGDEADEGAYIFIPATEFTDPMIIVKNEPFTLKAVKTDAKAGTKLADVHFALYRQVESSTGQMIKDYWPIAGYEDLVTNAQGVIPKITEDLDQGTYYLVETQALDKYVPIDPDVCFTISDRGVVTMENSSDRMLDVTTEADGTIAYTMTIINTEATQKIQIRKVDIANPLSSKLEGAIFDMYKVENGRQDDEPLHTGITSNSDGMLEYTDSHGDANILFELPVGTYHLVETEAPVGYKLRDYTVVINVSSGNVTYDEGTTLSESGNGRTYDAASRTYTLRVSNSSGTALPDSGGPGTYWIYLIGLLLITGCGLTLVVRKRMAG